MPQEPLGTGGPTVGLRTSCSWGIQECPASSPGGEVQGVSSKQGGGPPCQKRKGTELARKLKNKVNGEEKDGKGEHGLKNSCRGEEGERLD